MTSLPTKNLTLDPENWEEFRALAHRMLDETIDSVRLLREGPAWEPPPAEIKRKILDEPMPLQGEGDQAAYEQFAREVWPYRNGNLDPRFYGWVQGTGTPLSFMADMLASAMNPHLAGCHQSPVFVEQKVIDWLREAMGFPTGSSGLLLSGATMANLTGLAVARHAQACFDVREEGLQGGHPNLVVYGSTETHMWATKAVEFLGMGRRSFRKIPVNTDFTINLNALREAIRNDREKG
ncbi:MAG TPA: pyridoxal-dependent decarboxylase, partial [Fimbriimonas sp.]|nr:pyridoxal-dependent decarboxylase [Fimbriimonas sp.]